MNVIGRNRVTDWPKLGPSLLIAAALVVAIRTARWAAKSPASPHLSDVDVELDQEIAFAVRVTGRVLLALLKSNPSVFPGRYDPSTHRMRRTYRSSPLGRL